VESACSRADIELVLNGAIDNAIEFGLNIVDSRLQADPYTYPLSTPFVDRKWISAPVLPGLRENRSVFGASVLNRGRWFYMQGFRLNTSLGMLLVRLDWGRERPHFPTPNILTRVRLHAQPEGILPAQPAGMVPQHRLFPFGHPALDENVVRVLSGQ
jgi:hypothetical protein